MEIIIFFFHLGREKQLNALMRLYDEHEAEMCDALAQDLRKSKQESIINEVELLRNDLRNLLMNLNDYAKPEKVKFNYILFNRSAPDAYDTSLWFFPFQLQPEKTFVNMLDDVLIYKDPFGVVLVIGAWNYPIQLTLLPVAAAIAAGNCVVIKPSEVAPASAKFIADFIPKYLDNVCSI